jgi:hypothetical protein
MQNPNPRIHSIFVGLLLIMIGIIIFLINSGYGSWDIIWQLWRFWPVLIILLGVRILWRGPSGEWFSHGFWLLVAVGIIVLLIMSPRSGTGPAESGNLTHTVVNRADFPEVTAGKATVRFGGGQIVLGSNTKEWLEGDFGGFNAQSLVKNVQTTLEVDLKQTGHLSRRWWRHQGLEWNDKQRPQRDFRWDIQLSPEIPWNIELKTGGVKGNADLTPIPVKQLALKMGAGDFSLILGDKSNNTAVTIDSGASHIKVKVPRDSGVKVKLSGALVNTNIKNWGWISQNQTYTSPDYETAAHRVEIVLNMAVGDFDLEK